MAIMGSEAVRPLSAQFQPFNRAANFLKVVDQLMRAEWPAWGETRADQSWLLAKDRNLSAAAACAKDVAMFSPLGCALSDCVQ